MASGESSPILLEEESSFLDSASTTTPDEETCDGLSSDAISIQSKLRSGELVLNRITNKRSFIWDHFSRVYDPKKKTDLEYFACNKCKAPFKLDKSGGTGKFSGHLSKRHGVTQERATKEDGATDPKQTRISFHFPKTSLGKAQSDRIIDQLLKLCIDRCLPFDVCCSDSMMDVVYASLKIDGLPRADQEKLFKMCDESTLRKSRLPKKFDQIAAKVKENVRTGCCGSGGVTVDLWSDKFRHREYIAVTLHYLDAGFVLNTYCLGCRQVFETKITHVVIARLVRSILSEYGLDPKNMIFVSDSGANVKAAFEYNGWTRLACFAHDLDLLVATDGFGKSETPVSTTSSSATGGVKAVPQIQELISDCKALVTHFKRGNGQRR